MGSVIIPSGSKIVNRMRKVCKRIGWKKFLLHWHTGESLDDERLWLDERRQFERSLGFLELGKI